MKISQEKMALKILQNLLDRVLKEHIITKRKESMQDYLKSLEFITRIVYEERNINIAYTKWGLVELKKIHPKLVSSELLGRDTYSKCKESIGTIT